MRNPFSNTVEAAESKTRRAWEVNGILWTPEGPLALLGGHVVKAGDTIKGMKVIEVGRTTVTVKDGKETKVLSVGKD